MAVERARRKSRHSEGAILAEGIDFPEGSPSFSLGGSAMMRSLGARTLPTNVIYPSLAHDSPCESRYIPLLVSRGRRVGANGVAERHSRMYAEDALSCV